MSLMNDNIIPGNYGKVFGTDAKFTQDLERIKTKTLELKGIKNVLLNLEVYPREFTIHTSKLITIADVEKKVMATGFNAIPKGLFEL
jgi:hypothetical protein